MRVLVTGGAGFIGSNFIHYWLRKHANHQIINLDKITYAGHPESLKDVENHRNYRLVKGDIRDIELVESIMKSTDLVVHFAAESHVDRSIIDPRVFMETNVIGTQTLLEAAKKNNIKRFHHVSTDEVFGSLALNSKKKFDEKTAYSPHSPYAASKAASDHIVRAYGDTFGLPISITNCSNNFGPYQDPEKMIPRFITNIIEGKKVPVYGDGKYTRDWLYVEDHCRAIEAVLLHGKEGETYCVGGQLKNVSNLELTKKILAIMDKDDSSIEYVKDRPGHDRKYAVDWTKINKELEWQPQRSLDEWLSRTVKWYQEYEWWWKPLKKRAESIYK